MKRSCPKATSINCSLWERLPQCQKRIVFVLKHFLHWNGPWLLVRRGHRSILPPQNWSFESTFIPRTWTDILRHTKAAKVHWFEFPTISFIDTGRIEPNFHVWCARRSTILAISKCYEAKDETTDTCTPTVCLFVFSFWTCEDDFKSKLNTLSFWVKEQFKLSFTSQTPTLCHRSAVFWYKECGLSFSKNEGDTYGFLCIKYKQDDFVQSRHQISINPLQWHTLKYSSYWCSLPKVMFHRQ